LTLENGSEERVHEEATSYAGADRPPVARGRPDAREGPGVADLEQEIGVLLLDGWNEPCLPVLAMLEARPAPGGLMFLEDTDQDAVTDCLPHLRDPANACESVECPVDDGVEISCRAG
jgi:hypothetical protein